MKQNPAPDTARRGAVPPRLRVATLALAAVALPLTLALVTYALTGPSLGATIGVAPEPASRPATPVTAGQPPASTQSPTPPVSTPRDDHCDNPDHADEARCQPGGGGSDD